MIKDKIDQLIEDGLKQIDTEIQQEDDIRERAEYLARQLAFTPMLKVPINDVVYVLAMKMVKDYQGRQIILLAVEDELKKKLYGDKYSPALYSAEFNDFFTLEENCQTLVSAFLGKVTGNFKIETLEDEGTVKVAREKNMQKQ